MNMFTQLDKVERIRKIKLFKKKINGNYRPQKF